MKRPLGLLLVIIWCSLRGFIGTWGSVRIGLSALHGYGAWRDVAFVFVAEGAIWLWLAVALISRWSFARWATVLWCAIIIVWSSYGFYSVALPRWNQFRYGGVYALTIAIHGAIIVYLLRPTAGSFFKYEELA